MVRSIALSKRALALASASALVLATLAPALLSNSVARAAQITERSITISSSEVSAAGTTYSVSFIPSTAGTIEGIVVDFCQDSPLVGVVCDKTNGVTAVPTAGTVTVTQNAVSEAYDAVAGTTPQAGRLMLTETVAPTNLDTTNPVTFSFTATNPSELGTFFARIITFTDDADALTYDSSSTGANNPGTSVDDGGVALSTADQLQVNARVQEQLEFCVAAIDNTDITLETDCTAGQFATPETTVDLGVIDSGAASASPVATSNGGNDLTGGMIIRTNAVNGATISYYAEDDATGGAADYLGALRVPGADCVNEPGTSSTDQCFNSSDVGLDLTTAIEGFGARVNDIEDTASAAGGTTGNLTASANYNAATFAWDALGATREVASSATVLDYTILELQFGARTAATTPTGSYQVVSTYIATATY